jgi:hypothetical protein
MDWLEQNIDAYRIIADVLGELREAVRQGLEREHGEKWYRKGLPETVLERLVAAKEREQAIDWYESQYQQVMDYAVFPDLLEIIEHNSNSFPEITGLAPSAALLTARFMELEVMRAKLGRTRPITESELSFLGTFHLRFRKAMADSREGAGASTKPPARKARATENPPDEVVVEEAAGVPEEKVEDQKPVKTRKAADDSRPRFPQRQAQTPSSRAADKDEEDETTEEPSPVATDEEPTDVRDGDDAAGSEKPPTEKGKKKLGQALEEGDNAAILRELYREVTAIAEGMWSSDVIPAPLVWEQVTRSDWYELNFSRLGLQPLSDFYEVISTVDKRMSAGIDKNELQDLLKEANFAKILLGLRDMFQKNNV